TDGRTSGARMRIRFHPLRPRRVLHGATPAESNGTHRGRPGPGPRGVLRRHLLLCADGVVPAARHGQGGAATPTGRTTSRGATDTSAELATPPRSGERPLVDPAADPRSADRGSVGRRARTLRIRVHLSSLRIGQTTAHGAGRRTRPGSAGGARPDPAGPADARGASQTR